MTQRIKWPEAGYARIFIRPVLGLSEEIQRRMIDRAIEKLDIDSAIYESPLIGDKQNERGSLLHDCKRGDEVVIVARLDCLARKRVEVKTSITIDFALFVSSLLQRCQYILVLDDNMGDFKPITSLDDDWDAVMERAVYVATNGRKLSSEKAKDMQSRRWAGQFRGVVKEWTLNPERAKELEDMGRIWRDPKYTNEQQAYDAMPEEVRAQIKSVVTARKIFGKRKPNNKNLGRKKKVNGPHELPAAIYDVIDDGEIVYTGMTGDPYTRMKSHLQTGIASNDSFMEVIEWFGSRDEAFQAESVRISVLQPPRNGTFVSDSLSLGRHRYGTF